MTVINLFPRDNRSVELASAVGLLLLALNIYLHPEALASMPRQGLEYWVPSCFFLGALQFGSLMAYPHTELLRAILSWINGLFWIWLALSVSGLAVAAIMLGATNLYAFVINVNMLRTAWKD